MMRVRKSVTGMRTANATWVLSVFRSAEDTGTGTKGGGGEHKQINWHISNSKQSKQKTHDRWKISQVL